MIVWLSSWVLFFELCVKEILHHYYCISLLSQPFHCILSPFSLSSLPVNVIMLRVCRQKDRVHPAVQRSACSTPGPWARCWIANRVFANISILLIYIDPASLHRQQPASIAWSLLTTREKLSCTRPDWSISLYTVLSLVNACPADTCHL